MTKEEEKIAKRLIFLRNLITHEYYRITEKEIRKMPNLLLKISNFVEMMS